MAAGAAITVCLLLSEPGPCPRFGLIHTEHEGSHAIAQAFSQEYGSPQLLELLDVWYWPNREGALHRARNAFFAGNLHSLGRLLKLSTFPHKTSIHIPTNVECQQGMIVGALLRTKIVERAAYFGGTLSVFVLVRTDLMRWALSFPEANGDPCRHPQFGGCLASSAKQVVNVTGLLRKAHELVEIWRRKERFAVRLAKSLLRCPAFVLYEDFLTSNQAVIQGMFTHVARDARLTKGTMPGKMESYSLRTAGHVLVSGFRKQHDANISSWVANADDVLDHFSRSSYPTWDQVIGTSSFSRICG